MEFWFDSLQKEVHCYAYFYYGMLANYLSESGIEMLWPNARSNSALYGATKAFEKSLGLSMAKEMEPHGVGVTYLMPGPVVDTQFRHRSGTGRALCWYPPYYPRPAQFVVHLGVMSILEGDTQAIPSWQNRAFCKILWLMHFAATSRNHGGASGMESVPDAPFALFPQTKRRTTRHTHAASCRLEAAIQSSTATSATQVARTGARARTATNPRT
jgi:hypothetical protein